MNRNRNIMRIGKSLVSGLVVTGLILGSVSYTQAETVSKEESVYVTADAEGNTTKIIVSDWLKNAGVGGPLKDASTLQDIENLKGEETFTRSGDSLDWQAGSKDIYYQGTTDKELPVGVSVSYQLDGADISPAELLGKSGKVTICVSYENYSSEMRSINGKKQQIYTPFIMLTGIILPTDKFDNVEVDNGKVINEGTNHIVVGYGMPGMAKSLDLDEENADRIPDHFEVTADVTDFSIGNTITYANASMFGEIDLDANDSLEELEDSIETLVDASRELVNGTDGLSKGMGELNDKFEDYVHGEKKLNKGIHTLTKSGKKLVDGVKEYSTGVDEIAKGVQSYVEGAKEITDGNATLYQAVKGMPESYRMFSEGIQAYTAGVDKLADPNTSKALTDGADSVSGGISTLNSSLTELEKSYENYELLIGAIEGQAAQMTDEVQKATLLGYAAKLRELYTGQKASVGTLKSATDANSDLKTGANQVSAGIKTVLQGAAALSGKSKSLREADTTLNGSIQSLVTNIEKLKKGGETLSKNDKKLLAAAKKIVKAGKTVRSGSKKLISGTKELKKGSNALDRATGQVTKGIRQLSEGSGELKSGMREFDREGMRKMDELYHDDFLMFKARLSAIEKVSEEYTNFSGISKGMDGEVKFIIETEEVEKEEEE